MAIERMERSRDVHNPQVVISVSEVEKEDKAPEDADPQSFCYFCVLFLTALLALLVPLGLAPKSKWNKPLFKPHHDTLMIIVDALLSVSALSSIILVFAGFFLRRWMKNIYYTILKTIGCFSAIPTPFLLTVVIFVPHKLNLIAYSVICGIFLVVILVAYYFAWKYACRYNQDTSFNEYPIHWSAFLVILVPCACVLPYYIPDCAVAPFMAVCGLVLGVIYCGMLTVFIVGGMKDEDDDDDEEAN